MWGARYGPLAWRLRLLHFPGSLKGPVDSPDFLSHPPPISIANPQFRIYDLQTCFLWFLNQKYFFFQFSSLNLGQSLAPWGDFAASLCSSPLLRSIWLLAFPSYTRSFDSLNVGVLRDTKLIKQTRVRYHFCPTKISSFSPCLMSRRESDEIRMPVSRVLASPPHPPSTRLMAVLALPVQPLFWPHLFVRILQTALVPFNLMHHHPTPPLLLPL